MRLKRKTPEPEPKVFWFWNWKGSKDGYNTVLIRDIPERADVIAFVNEGKNPRLFSGKLKIEESTLRQVTNSELEAYERRFAGCFD